jgi:hypothetical protein
MQEPLPAKISDDENPLPNILFLESSFVSTD